jgi:hypothetical protein
MGIPTAIGVPDSRKEARSLSLGIFSSNFAQAAALNETFMSAGHRPRATDRPQI